MIPDKKQTTKIMIKRDKNGTIERTLLMNLIHKIKIKFRLYKCQYCHDTKVKDIFIYTGQYAWSEECKCDQNKNPVSSNT